MDLMKIWLYVCIVYIVSIWEGYWGMFIQGSLVSSLITRRLWFGKSRIEDIISESAVTPVCTVQALNRDQLEGRLIPKILWVMKKFATNNTGKRLRIPPTPAKRLDAQLDNMLFKEVLPWLLPQKFLINDWAQIAPKNIINQPGNREVEGRLERKIGAGINFIATLKMIIFPTTPYLASRSICVRFEEQIHIADRNWREKK